MNFWLTANRAGQQIQEACRGLQLGGRGKINGIPSDYNVRLDFSLRSCPQCSGQLLNWQTCARELEWPLVVQPCHGH